MKRLLAPVAILLFGFAMFAWGAAPTILGTIGNYQPAHLTQAGTSCTISATATGCSGLNTGDCGTTIDFTNSGSITVTLPNNIIIVGCQVTFSQTGAGKVTLVAGSGATLHSAHGFSGTFAQYSLIGTRVYQNTGGTAAQYEFFGDGV